MADSSRKQAVRNQDAPFENNGRKSGKALTVYSADQIKFEQLGVEQGGEQLQASRTTLPAPDVPEIITPEEFIERMKIGETTFWKWLNTGKLKPGRHFIQIDRVIRFPWCKELIWRILEDCRTVQPDQPEVEEEQPVSKNHRRRKGGECPINLSY